METELSPAERKAEELKAPETFDARKALTGATYPTEEITVFRDAALMHQANKLAEEVAKLEDEAHRAEQTAKTKSAEENGGITDDPDYLEYLEYAKAKREEATAAEESVAALIQKVRDSAMTFLLKGLAPKQIALIDKKWRREIKFPARKNYEQTPEGQEEYELEVFERNKDRNEAINHDAIACSILSVTNGKGQVDKNAWKTEDVENLFETLLETEYEKLRLGYQELTFAHTIFNRAVVEDTDFLSRR